mmetsp:Transcript_12360/g.20174  ORF Transcript_12360/g.20174 Transcript_12360/m.20174 type:complete len:174 (+) Transcript_12360:75-596(+)
MAIASAQIQTVSLCQALALPFDDGLSSSLLEEGSYYTKKISMYRPGELLRMSIQEVSKSDLSGLDVISHMSTSSTAGFDVSSSSHGDSDELEAEGQSGFDGLMGNITLPSVGSANHGLGSCRPCGFVHKGSGCSSGAECQFCHLCLPGSIELLRKLKKKKFTKTAAKDSHKNS